VSLIRFTKSAKKDLGEIYEYIAQDNIAAADKLKARLQQRWCGLVDMPRIGSDRKKLKPNLRSVTEGNYVIFYRVLVEEIQIVRVLHSSRDAETVFTEFDEWIP
jgi:toxin ParE1/3/4